MDTNLAKRSLDVPKTIEKCLPDHLVLVGNVKGPFPFLGGIFQTGTSPTGPKPAGNSHATQQNTRNFNGQTQPSLRRGGSLSNTLFRNLQNQSLNLHSDLKE